MLWPQVILSQAQVNSLCFIQSLHDVPSCQRRQHIKNAHFAEGVNELARGHAPCGLLQSWFPYKRLINVETPSCRNYFTFFLELPSDSR